MSKVDALLELERRGALPPEGAALLGELRKRGMIQEASQPEVDQSVADANDARAKNPPRKDSFVNSAMDVILGSPQAAAAVGFGKAAIGGPLQLGAKLVSPLFPNAEPAVRDFMRAGDALVKGAQDKTPGMAVPRFGAEVAGAGAALAAPLSKITPFGTGSVMARTGNAATQGGVAGLAMPVLDGDYWSQKGLQVGGGALAGAVFSPAAEALGAGVGKGVNYLHQKATTKTVNDVQATIAIVKALQDEKIDWGALSQDAQAALLNAAKQQMATGGKLDAKALARYADFEQLGIDPLKPWVTRDPGQFTQAENLRRMQAAQGGGPLVDRVVAGNARLSSTLDNLGAAQTTTPVEAGERIVGAVKAVDASKKAKVNALYEKARETSGDLPLDANPQIAALFQHLDEAGRLDFLPSAVQKRLNSLASGEAGLTIGRAESLKTMIAAEIRKAQRSDDGNAVYALKKAYEAIDNAEPVSGTAEAAVQAYRTARDAARQRFAWQDSAPGISKALDDVAPDKFVQQYVIGGNARDVAALKTAIALDPNAAAAMKGQVLAWLKGKAFGAGDNFLPVQFDRAMTTIGKEKLALIFSPEELATLQAAQRAGKNMTTQPVGSAVNNSNTATTAGAGVMAALDFIAQKANKLPFGKAAVSDPLAAFVTGRQAAGQMGVPPIAQPPAPLIPPGRVGGLLAPVTPFIVPPLLSM